MSEIRQTLFINRRAALQRPVPKSRRPRRPRSRSDDDESDTSEATQDDEAPGEGGGEREVEEADSEEDVWCEKVIDGAVVRVRRVLRPKSCPLSEEQRQTMMLYK